MQDETKHKVAKFIFHLVKGIVLELKMAIRPLCIGFVLFLMFSSMTGNGICNNDMLITFAFVGLFLPLLIQYCIRTSKWVIKWKDAPSVSEVNNNEHIDSKNLQAQTGNTKFEFGKFIKNIS